MVNSAGSHAENNRRSSTCLNENALKSFKLGVYMRPSKNQKKMNKEINTRNEMSPNINSFIMHSHKGLSQLKSSYRFISDRCTITLNNVISFGNKHAFRLDRFQFSQRVNQFIWIQGSAALLSIIDSRLSWTFKIIFSINGFFNLIFIGELVIYLLIIFLSSHFLIL